MVNIKNMEVFADKIRLLTSKTYLKVGGGHFGGTYSIAETLAVLYSIMNYDAKNPDWDQRDYLVLSKGHASPAHYAALALKGFFPAEELETFNDNDSHYGFHPNRLYDKGVDITTGSLGQGLSQAVGIAYGLKHLHKPNKVYCIVGDGESNEGQIWEAVQFAVAKKLDNLVIFVDDNKKQSDGFTNEVMMHLDYVAIYKSFGFNTTKVDGGDAKAIYEAIISSQKVKDVPSVIVLDSIKGKGVPYFEQFAGNHFITVNDEVLKVIKPYLEKWEAEEYE